MSAIKTWWVTAGEGKELEILAISKEKEQAEKALAVEAEKRAFKALGITVEKFKEAAAKARSELRMELFESRKTEE